MSRSACAGIAPHGASAGPRRPSAAAASFRRWPGFFSQSSSASAVPGPLADGHLGGAFLSACPCPHASPPPPKPTANGSLLSKLFHRRAPAALPCGAAWADSAGQTRHSAAPGPPGAARAPGAAGPAAAAAGRDRYKHGDAEPQRARDGFEWNPSCNLTRSSTYCDHAQGDTGDPRGEVLPGQEEPMLASPAPRARTTSKPPLPPQRPARTRRQVAPPPPSPRSRTLPIAAPAAHPLGRERAASEAAALEEGGGHDKAEDSWSAARGGAAQPPGGELPGWAAS